MSKPELVRQLTGASPVDSNLMGNQREFANIGRTVFDALRQFHIAQSSARAQLEATYAELNTPKSFSSGASVDKVLNALAKTKALDAALTFEMNDIPNQMRTQVEKSDLSASDRATTADQMLDGYRNSQSTQAAMKMLNVKSTWISSETDLYRYAEQHLDQLYIKNDQIRITVTQFWNNSTAAWPLLTDNAAPL